MHRVVGIFAHVDSGKTTLSEQLLYKCGRILKAGRVDNKNAFLDYNEIERKRGITVFADEACFETSDIFFSLIDTPGHNDFSGEMERSLYAIDCAILIISSVDGVDGHTQTIWKLLHKKKIPTIIFLNKADMNTAQPQKVLNYLEKSWDIIPIVIKSDILSDGFDAKFCEELSMGDEELADVFLEKGGENDDFINLAKHLFLNHRLFPTIIGSALKAEGIDEILKTLVFFTPTEESDGTDLRAICYKVRHNSKKERITFLKILSGYLKAKDEIKIIDKNGKEIKIKANELKKYNGAKSKALSIAKKGELCGVIGLREIYPGDIVGKDPKKAENFQMVPLMTHNIIFDKSISFPKLVEALSILEDEEPLLALHVGKNNSISIRVMGSIQLEILKYQLLDRFGFEVDFGDGEVLYRETISNTVVGHGHFEPLRHYAEVHLRLSPNEKGKGITFSSSCSGDDLALNWQRLIKTHVFEKEHLGVLTGSPLTDVHFELLAGRAHVKHTDGGDFRESVYRAIRQGLMQAQNVLLEPILKFRITLPMSLISKVLNDIGNMDGTYDPPQTFDNETVLTGYCPARTMQNYSENFASFSKGNGSISLEFLGYSPCKIQEQIVKKKAYNPEHDLENSPDSVFCSHGTAYTVKWNEIENVMHIKP